MTNYVEKDQLVSIYIYYKFVFLIIIYYLATQIRNLTSDLEQAREQLDEEQEGKSELQKQVTKLSAEISQWRSRYESEGLFSIILLSFLFYLII
jgi:peptidoglycan hydrolase CwlO-like protein